MRLPTLPRPAQSAALVLALLAFALLAAPARPAERMPDFPHTGQESWVNTTPLTPADLRGQVVLIEIWTSV